MPWTIPDNIWIVGIVSSIIGSIFFAFLVILLTPLRNALTNFSRWVRLKIHNPEIDVEMVLSGDIKEVSKSLFFTRMGTILSEVSDNTPIHNNEFIKSSKNFGKYSVEILISPISEANELCNYVSIILKFKSMRIKNIKLGLTEVQNFLFKDLVTSIHRNFDYNPDIKKESISVSFTKNPKMLGELKELNVTSLTSISDEIEILLTLNKLKITGNITPPSFLKMEKLVIKNLIS